METELKDTYKRLLLYVNVMMRIVAVTALVWITYKAIKNEDPKASLNQPLRTEMLVFNH